MFYREWRTLQQGIKGCMWVKGSNHQWMPTNSATEHLLMDQWVKLWESTHAGKERGSMVTTSSNINRVRCLNSPATNFWQSLWEADDIICRCLSCLTTNKTWLDMPTLSQHHAAAWNLHVMNWLFITLHSILLKFDPSTRVYILTSKWLILV